jgi:hypothetical protein
LKGDTRRVVKVREMELEFDAEGQIRQEREHLLNYERPNAKIYPV